MQYHPLDEKSRKEFERWGVPEPQFDTHGTDEEHRKIREEMRKRRHQWVQQGNFLKCVSCENEHGYPIGVDHILKGMDKKGMPILEKLTLS